MATNSAGTCPGCIGRGTGTACCMCTKPIPEDLRREKNGGPAYPGDTVRADCADCRAGQPHAHR